MKYIIVLAFLLNSFFSQASVIKSCRSLLTSEKQGKNPFSILAVRREFNAKVIQNPLINKFHPRSKDGRYLFHLISLEHIQIAFDYYYGKAEKTIQHLAHSTASPNFENTVMVLETYEKELSRVYSAFALIHGAKSSDKSRALDSHIHERWGQLDLAVISNKKVFQRLKQVYENRHRYSDLQSRLIEHHYNNFVINGVQLNKDQLARYEKLSKELTKLEQTYSKNILETDSSENNHIIVSDVKMLRGLSRELKAQAQKRAVEQKKKGYILVASGSELYSLLQLVESAELRQTIYQVGVLDKNAFLAKTNEKTVKKILKIKQQMAQLNGFETFADLSLSQKMAGSTKTVIDFFETIKISLLEQAKQEYQELESYFKQHNPDKEMQPWDSLFWRNKLQKARYNFNEKELTPYLNVEATINGVFEVIKRLYQVELVYNKDIPVYANDVLAYEVFDSSSGQRQKMGLVYLDLFERPGEKQRGAWAFPVQSHATDQLPIIGISANFTKSPEGWKKSQLEIDDVITLFHEFGHGMHNLLSTSPYSSLSGTKVAWDFVEFPSQWFEKFASQYEVLKLFARHSKTGEVIPEELVKRYNNSENFFSATLTLKQLSMAWTDMAYYMKADAFNKHDDLYAFERHIHQPLNVAPFDTKFLLITDFPHVVTGGYPAGYYGYLWSNVLSVDAFNMFKKNGLFNPDWAEKIKTLLAKGNTEDPLDAFKQMMGREPNPNALVESLLQNDEH